MKICLKKMIHQKKQKSKPNVYFVSSEILPNDYLYSMIIVETLLAVCIGRKFSFRSVDAIKVSTETIQFLFMIVREPQTRVTTIIRPTCTALRVRIR